MWILTFHLPKQAYKFCSEHNRYKNEDVMMENYTMEELTEALRLFIQQRRLRQPSCPVSQSLHKQAQASL